VTTLQTPSGVDELELVVSGMTCGSCAARVERTLARQPGVERAAVNLATSRARVVVEPATVTVERLAVAVEQIGYGLTPSAERVPAEVKRSGDEGVEQRRWLRRVVVAWALGLVVLVLSLGFWRTRGPAGARWR